MKHPETGFSRGWVNSRISGDVYISECAKDGATKAETYTEMSTWAEQTTSYEQAKLARRHYEYAILQDALSRGMPYHQIPVVLATATEQLKSCMRWLFHHIHKPGLIYLPFNADSHQQHHRHGHMTRPLDDSFLRRTYKGRACVWVAPAFHSGFGAVRNKYGYEKGQGQGQQQQIHFHNWVPGESDRRKRRKMKAVR